MGSAAKNRERDKERSNYYENNEYSDSASGRGITRDRRWASLVYDRNETRKRGVGREKAQGSQFRGFASVASRPTQDWDSISESPGSTFPRLYLLPSRSHGFGKGCTVRSRSKRFCDFWQLRPGGRNGGHPSLTRTLHERDSRDSKTDLRDR